MFYSEMEHTDSCCDDGHDAESVDTFFLSQKGRFSYFLNYLSLRLSVEDEITLILVNVFF